MNSRRTLTSCQTLLQQFELDSLFFFQNPDSRFNVFNINCLSWALQKIVVRLMTTNFLPLLPLAFNPASLARVVRCRSRSRFPLPASPQLLLLCLKLDLDIVSLRRPAIPVLDEGFVRLGLVGDCRGLFPSATSGLPPVLLKSELLVFIVADILANLNHLGMGTALTLSHFSSFLHR